MFIGSNVIIGVKTLYINIDLLTQKVVVFKSEFGVGLST